MATKKVTTTQSTARLIYVGPTIKGSRLVRYQVFMGGLPTHVDDIFAKVPQIKNLFVEIKNLSAAERDIATNGTPLNKYFKLAKEEA